MTKEQEFGVTKLLESEQEIPERSDPYRESPKFYTYTLSKHLDDPWIIHVCRRLQATQERIKIYTESWTTT